MPGLPLPRPAILPRQAFQEIGSDWLACPLLAGLCHSAQPKLHSSSIWSSIRSLLLRKLHVLQDLSSLLRKAKLGLSRSWASPLPSLEGKRAWNRTPKHDHHDCLRIQLIAGCIHGCLHSKVAGRLCRSCRSPDRLLLRQQTPHGSFEMYDESNSNSEAPAHATCNTGQVLASMQRCSATWLWAWKAQRSQSMGSCTPLHVRKLGLQSYSGQGSFFLPLHFSTRPVQQGLHSIPIALCHKHMFRTTWQSFSGHVSMLAFYATWQEEAHGLCAPAFVSGPSLYSAEDCSDTAPA